MKKSIILIVAVAIIAGLIVIFTAGFNYDILTKEHQQIRISIGDEYDNSELKKTIEDVLGNKVEIQKTGDFEDQAIVSAKEIPSEKIEEIVNKVNEKYGKEISASSITITDIPGAKLMDLLTPYISSFIIATVLILGYLSIRYRKQGVIKVILKTIGITVIVELAVFGIVALVRVPVGANIPLIGFTAYILAILYTTINCENKFQKAKLEDTSKKSKE